MPERATVRWLRHDADLRLRLRAPDPESLFLAAARAVVAASVEGTLSGTDRRRVALSEPDRESLLVAWLNEILYLVSSGGFLPAGVEGLRLGGGDLSAELIGGPPDPSRHRFLREIKAATFHDLSVVKTGSVWSATVLFDV
ncbi:MAG: archease [Candidatus Eisenbacteria bacterium]|nr:archease [Candidatus Eisenbacteria bacterium]